MLLKGTVVSLEKEGVRGAVQKCFRTSSLHTPRFLHFSCGDPTHFSFMPKLNITVESEWDFQKSHSTATSRKYLYYHGHNKYLGIHSSPIPWRLKIRVYLPLASNYPTPFKTKPWHVPLPGVQDSHLSPEFYGSGTESQTTQGSNLTHFITEYKSLLFSILKSEMMTWQETTLGTLVR